MLARSAGAAVLVALVLAPPARASDTDDDQAGKSFEQTLTLNADKGGFVPFVQAARFEGHGIGRILSGYDSARGGPVLDLSATAHVWGPLSIQAGAVVVDGAQSMKPSAGVRVQALRQEQHGIDAAVIVQYRPEGLTQSTSDFGEIESVIALGRNWGRLGTFANLAFGSDPDGKDRDGEVRLSGLFALSERLRAGLDTRVRFDIASSPSSLRDGQKATLDVVAGPTASYLLGPVALVAEAGYSGVQLAQAASFKSGAIALFGLGTAF